MPEGCGMRIGDKEVAWKEGEIMVFDDSFEHEVWNNGTEERTIFILDIFHPDLTDSQKKQDLFEIISWKIKIHLVVFIIFYFNLCYFEFLYQTTPM